MSLARTLLLAAIRGYRRRVSPYKGFACAYRVHAGGCSCSTLGLRAVARYGAWRGLGVLRLRLAQCRLVAAAVRDRPVVARPAQAGFVDCALPCDASCVDASACLPGDACTMDSACEAATCCDCGDPGDCGWPWSRRAPATPARRRRGDPVVRQPGADLQDAEPPAGR